MINMTWFDGGSATTMKTFQPIAYAILASMSGVSCCDTGGLEVAQLDAEIFRL